MTRNSTAFRRPPPAPDRRDTAGRVERCIGVFIGLMLGLTLAARDRVLRGRGDLALMPRQVGTRQRDSVRGALPTQGGEDRTPAASKTALRLLQDPARRGRKPQRFQVGSKVAPDRAVIDQGVKDRIASVPAIAGARRQRPANQATDEPHRAAKADRFWLQAGSFAAKPDAENLKAQLGARPAGKPTYSRATLPDKGVRYRVRLGPYDNADELNRIKNELRRGSGVRRRGDQVLRFTSTATRQGNSRSAEQDHKAVESLQSPRARRSPRRLTGHA